MLREFREFAIKGNVVDMAVGVVIGAAFGKVIDSLVKDVIMPPIGLALGNVDFANLFVILKQGALPGPYLTIDAAQKAGAVTLNYGALINTIVAFVIVAFCVFLIVKGVNRMRREPPTAPAAPAEDVVLLREIRDVLREKR